MTNTKTTKTAAAIKAAEQAVTEAVAKHAALLQEATTAEEKLSNAQAELCRVEQCIANDDPTAGLEDLTKADTELRFFKLQQQAKARAAANAEGAVRTARTALILARFEAGEYQIAMDRLTAEGEALASKIAAMLSEYHAKCNAHEGGRHALLADLKESDAMNDHGNGNPASPLAWGHEDQKRHKPFWIKINGELVPLVNGEYRVKRIQDRAELIEKYGEELAANVISL
jgi:hypothetical protein